MRKNQVTFLPDKQARKLERRLDVRDAEHRVAEAALKAVPSSCSELPDPELVRDFQAALDDLRRLKGEG